MATRRTRKAQGARTTRARTARASTGEDRIVDAALACAARTGWLRMSLSDVAAEAKLSLADVHAALPSKNAILRAFLRRADAAMLAAVPAPAAGDSHRDRLFAVMMARFDVLGVHRAAVLSILRAACCDPGTAGVLLRARRRTLGWMLESAGISASGPAGEARTHGLGLIAALAVAVWARDSSPDLAATMAHLDRQLRRAEAFGARIPL